MFLPLLLLLRSFLCRYHPALFQCLRLLLQDSLLVGPALHLLIDQFDTVISLPQSCTLRLFRILHKHRNGIGQGAEFFA